MAVIKMDWQRIVLLGSILIIFFALLFKWNQFQDEIALVNQAAITEVPATTFNQSNIDDSSLPSTSSGNDLPTVAVAANTHAGNHDVKGHATDRLIHIKSDTLDIWIDRLGGDIIRVSLPEHKVKLDGDKAFTLLNDAANSYYIAQSGLVGIDATDKADGRPLFNSSQSSYSLEEGEQQLAVDLYFEQNDVSITKRFEFSRGQYLIKLRYLIDNQSEKTWQANFYAQIKRDDHKPAAAADSGIGVSPYVGAATTTPEENYKKIDFDDLNKSAEEFYIQGGWVAMIQHYFVSAWIADKNTNNKFFLKKTKYQNHYLLGYLAPASQVAAGDQGEISAQFYVGPKNIDKLESIAQYLDLTIDFGWLWWIAKPLFHLLDFLHNYIGNWGWSIIALTIIIKGIFFYPSAISYRSMAKMRKLGPKMQELKERYGDDRQKMSQEMMQLYKKEKANPMSGCLPILIQMPVFIALYWVLMESVEIRHAPFIGWIQDLSVMDPYFILPLLMGGTMFIQQRLNPTPPDPMQAKLMQWMPVAFTFMFLWFPAGLVVYWVTNNTLSIIQQYAITRAIEKSDKA